MDRAISTVVASSDVASDYDPPVVPPSDDPLPRQDGSDLPEIDVDSPDCHSETDVEATVDPPEEISRVDFLSDHSAPETVTFLTEDGPGEASTIGHSLVDPVDELLASRLTGYLNIFQNLKKHHFQKYHSHCYS